jgi:hypothetical protein
MLSFVSSLKRFGIDLKPYYLFMESLEEALEPQIDGDLSEYRCQMLGSDDMKELDMVIKDFNSERKIEVLKSGEKCIGLKHNSKIVALMWISCNEFRYGSTYRKLNENEAWLAAMHTLDSYRGKNLAPYLRYKSYEFLQNMGRDVLYSASEYFNTPAIKFKEKLNARKLKLIFYCKFFDKFLLSFTVRTYPALKLTDNHGKQVKSEKR